MLRRFLLSLGTLCLLHAAQAQTQTQTQTWPLKGAPATEPETYAFLPQVLQGVDIVTLGESIHMTHEFPVVRLGMVRELNEQLGFHTLAFEGSPVDLWATQDRFLHSAQQPEDAAAAMGGLFGIWNTPEYQQIFEYEAASWRTATPLYFTAWDIQPGNGHTTGGAEAFRLFAEQLWHYAQPPAGLDYQTWLQNIDRTRCTDDARSDDPAALHAIDQLRQWIALAEPAAEKAYPTLPHAAVLALIPDNLRRSMALCPPPGKTYWDIVSKVREEQAAPYTLQLQAALPNHKLMLWGHTHHMGYFPGSEAARLKAVLGNRLYSLNLFSDGGGAILLYSNVHEDFGYGRLPRARGALRDWIDGHGGSPLFVNLRNNPDPVFATPQKVQYESQWGAMKLPALSDGVLFVPDVHPPHFPAKQLMMLSLWHVRWWLGAGALVIFLLVLTLLVRAALRRIRRRKLRVPHP